MLPTKPAASQPAATNHHQPKLRRDKFRGGPSPALGRCEILGDEPLFGNIWHLVPSIPRGNANAGVWRSTKSNVVASCCSRVWRQRDTGLPLSDCWPADGLSLLILQPPRPARAAIVSGQGQPPLASKAMADAVERRAQQADACAAARLAPFYAPRRRAARAFRGPAPASGSALRFWTTGAPRRKKGRPEFAVRARGRASRKAYRARRTCGWPNAVSLG